MVRVMMPATWGRRASVFGVVALWLLVTAVGGPVARPVVAQPMNPAGEVAFWVFGDSEEQAVYRRIIEAYGAANPAVRVNFSGTASQGDYVTKLQTSFAGNAAPDVFLINYRRYGQFAGKGLIEPAEEWLKRGERLQKSDFYETALDAFSTGGVLQCVPQNLSSLVVYYNHDLFTRYNVPTPQPGWTWTDFVAAARALTLDTDGDGRNDVHGLGVEPQIVRASAFIWQRGGRIVDDEMNPTRITLDEPATLEALRWFVDLNTFQRVVPNQAEIRAEDIDSRFMSGRLAMRLDSRRAVPDYRTIKSFAWDVAALPQDASPATVLHSDAYCMSATSANKPAAWDFVQWANGPEGQALAARLGRTVPSLRAVANSDAFLDPARAPASSHVFLDVAPVIRRLPGIPSWPAIERVLNDEIERAFWGGDFNDAMATAQQKATAELRR